MVTNPNSQTLEVNSGMPAPLITTIIPTYRRPKLLRRAINSVLNQTYPNFQICVYDNASGDETAKVVAEFAKKDPRVKYHCHPETIGGLKNWNYGMEHLNTPFFSFLSDDDILLPEFYQTAMEGFQKHPEAIFSSTLTLMMNDQSEIWDSFSSNWMPGLYNPPQGLLAMLKNGHPTWTGIVFRSEVVKKLGILDQEIALVDLDFEFRAVAHFPFVISLNPGAIFVIHPGGAFLNLGFQDILPGWLKMTQKLREDNSIPVSVRRLAVGILEKRLKKMGFSYALRSILQGTKQETCKIVAILKSRYPLDKSVIFLLIVDNVCEHIPLVRYFLIFLNNFRKFVADSSRRKGARKLYEKYGHIFKKAIGECEQ